MQELVIMWDWLAFAVRWLHVITAIAWIGSSFYFVALDLGLRKVPHLPVGAHGEEWQVHGGGFYHIQKYLVAPEKMPDDAPPRRVKKPCFTCPNWSEVRISSVMAQVPEVQIRLLGKRPSL